MTNKNALNQSLPALLCAGCDRPIGARRVHYVTLDRRVVCDHCQLTYEGHAKLYPDCTDRDFPSQHHHWYSECDRAGASWLLGLLPDEPEWARDVVYEPSPPDPDWAPPQPNSRVIHREKRGL